MVRTDKKTKKWSELIRSWLEARVAWRRCVAWRRASMPPTRAAETLGSLLFLLVEIAR